MYVVRPEKMVQGVIRITFKKVKGEILSGGPYIPGWEVCRSVGIRKPRVVEVVACYGCHEKAFANRLRKTLNRLPAREALAMVRAIQKAAKRAELKSLKQLHALKIPDALQSRTLQ